jgi:Spy/CpxP family protein refolding chaperone
VRLDKKTDEAHSQQLTERIGTPCWIALIRLFGEANRLSNRMFRGFATLLRKSGLVLTSGALVVWSVTPALGQNPGPGANQRRLVPQFGQRRIGRPRVDGRPGARQGPLPRLNQPQKVQLQKRLMQALGLSPEQSMRLQQIRRDHEEERIAAGRRLRQARQALDRTIMSERYDEAAVRRATEELAEAQADKVRLEARIRSQIRNVLTTDQVFRFHQLERQLRREMREQNEQKEERDREQNQVDLLDAAGPNR